MTCPNTSQVHALHDGEVSPGRRLAVEAHLRECDDCGSLLDDLRVVSKAIRSAPLPALDAVHFERLYGAWHVDRQRAVLRISGWLTAAAAAVLVGTLVLFPGGEMPPVSEMAAVAQPSWEPVALLAPVVEDAGGRDVELVAVAQWMADDLAH